MKFQMRSAIALLLMCGILGAERISAQNSSVEVRLSLSVTDASGAAVSVGENDVKILENGVEQKITGFSERTGISKIGFIMDNSGSMRMRLDEINEIAKAIAGTMGDTDEAFILRLVGVDNTAIWLDWTSSKQNIEKAVNDMYIEGGQTSIINALNIAWKKLEPRISQDPNRKYSLVLISDAEERAALEDLVAQGAEVVARDLPGARRVPSERLLAKDARSS